MKWAAHELDNNKDNPKFKKTATRPDKEKNKYTAKAHNVKMS